MSAGAKETLMLHCAPTARVEPQEAVSNASPVAVMLVILRACVPRFVSFTVCDGLTVPAVCGVKTRLVVDREDSTGGRAMHVHDTLMVPGPLGALVVKVTFPVQAPVVGAATITLITQLALGASTVGQVLV